MDAQKMILAELNSEFGGSAAALGKTLPGQINIARESLRNLGGTLATQLVPAITTAVNSINRFLSNAQNQKTIIDGFKTGLAAVSGVVRGMRTAFQTLASAVGGSKNAIFVLIGAFAAFKALQMAASVTRLAQTFGLLAARERGAARATGGLKASLLGKAGLVGAAGIAAFALTTLILKATGLDKKLKSVGASAFDAAAKIGLVKDPGKQFEGKKLLSGNQYRAIRQQAARLEARGLTPAQATARIAAQRPNVARRDIEVLAGVRGKPPVVHTTVNLDGQTVAKNTTQHQLKNKKRNATQRRGR
jgi:hypothetical protein